MSSKYIGFTSLKCFFAKGSNIMQHIELKRKRRVGNIAPISHPYMGLDESIGQLLSSVNVDVVFFKTRRDAENYPRGLSVARPRNLIDPTPPSEIG